MKHRADGPVQATGGATSQSRWTRHTGRSGRVGQDGENPRSPVIVSSTGLSEQVADNIPHTSSEPEQQKNSFEMLLVAIIAVALLAVSFPFVMMWVGSGIGS